MKTIPWKVWYDEDRTGWVQVSSSWQLVNKIDRKQKMSSLNLEVLEAYRLGYEAGKAAQDSSTNSSETDIEFYFDADGDGWCTFLGVSYEWHEAGGAWIAFGCLAECYAPYTKVSAEAFYERFPEALNVRPNENAG